MKQRHTRSCRFHPMWLALLAVSLLAGAAQAQTKAYLANQTSNLVTVLDTANDAVPGTVPVGARPTQVAVSQDGQRAYVSNTNGNTVAVLDTATDAVRATIPVAAAPSVLAVTPNGAYVYVAVTGGVQVVSTALNAVVTTVNLSATPTGLAITPDGSRVYLTGGNITVLDTATNTVTASFLPPAASPEVSNNTGSIVITPDGSRAYITNTIFSFGFQFSAGGSVMVLDTANNTVVRDLSLFQFQPGPIALAPDGSRAYVGIQSEWVNTGYGAGFLPASAIATIDCSNNTYAGWTELGGLSAQIRNVPAAVAVTQDRSDVYVSIPRTNSVAVISTGAATVRLNIPVAASPGGIAMKPDPNAVITPYLIDAVDDNTAAPISSAGGTAVANVLANDTLGGIRATVTNVTLAQVSTSNPGVTLNPANGAVSVAAGTSVGAHSLVYQICETALLSNCDTATVTVGVRDPYIIDAVDDAATSVTGRIAAANILANDTLNGAAATLANVNLSQLSTSNAGLSLSANGAVTVAAGTSVGLQTLVYQICEKASPTNCDAANVSVNVIPFVVDAVNDSATVNRTGGTAVNVLTNDTFGGGAATTSNVTITQLSSAHAGVTLNAASGAVNVANGTPAGVYTFAYRLCETASPANCDTANVTITVTPYVIYAGNDTARGSSKAANVVLASVLTNDRLGNAPATTANVSLSLISLTPANNMIRLNPGDGSVSVLGKTVSGDYALIYQICEIGSPTNCARATVAITLSGK